MKQQRRRVKQVLSLEERLNLEAQQLRQRANELPPGIEKEAVLEQARQHDAAAHMTAWLASPGLSLPE
ncbi:hypothetical protein H8A95_03930 [Bradyrhizobium sp. Pear76]|uniref:hypothetical protein n=1 Tax=Bradyrhizobium oropedii TaxID=1571201 RepID=UPI001E428684|nr:hypothetical protein [Bradyrhizobium oropedii]MCC8961489.1 hypothetical protein [Bradyrhizobium oropedii]